MFTITWARKITTNFIGIELIIPKFPKYGFSVLQNSDYKVSNLQQFQVIKQNKIRNQSLLPGFSAMNKHAMLNTQLTVNLIIPNIKWKTLSNLGDNNDAIIIKSSLFFSSKITNSEKNRPKSKISNVGNKSQIL